MIEICLGICSKYHKNKIHKNHDLILVTIR